MYIVKVKRTGALQEVSALWDLRGELNKSC